MKIPLQRLQLCRESTLVYNPQGTILNAEESANLFSRHFGDYASEVMLILLLNSKQRPIGLIPAHIGTLDQTMCKVRDIFVPALLAGAKSIILGHNHPSGDVTFSESDVESTFALIHAGEILGVKVLDHICFSINEGNFSSMKQKGYM